MLFLIILFLALAAIAADILCYRHLKRHHAPTRHLRLFIVWSALTDSLPLITAVSGLMVRDNTTAYMTLAMWLFWAWMVTVPPRMVFYLFAILRLKWLGLAMGIGIVTVFIWGATAGRTTIRVSRVEICSERIPAGFDGFRIVQFSDTHLGTIVRPEKELGRIVDSINSLRPDLIVFSGDLVNIRYTELDDQAQTIFRRLNAPVVSVTGNHDAGAYIKDSTALLQSTNLQRLLERQRAMGWRVLEDTTVYLRRGSDSISLSGISFDPGLGSHRHDPALPPANLETTYRNVPDSLFNVTVAHLPQLWDQITDAGYGDLTLAGHVHSMQLKLHLFGHDWSPAQWLYARWSGRYDKGYHTLYINDGTGYVAYPMRLGAYPEITLITLERCK